MGIGSTSEPYTPSAIRILHDKFAVVGTAGPSSENWAMLFELKEDRVNPRLNFNSLVASVRTSTAFGSLSGGVGSAMRSTNLRSMTIASVQCIVSSFMSTQALQPPELPGDESTRSKGAVEALWYCSEGVVGGGGEALGARAVATVAPGSKHWELSVARRPAPSSGL
jgi:hypothetical protein